MTINNEQLKREVDLLRVDNTQLRANVNAMRDEIGRLRTENQRLKVSQWLGSYELFTYTIHHPHINQTIVK